MRSHRQFRHERPSWWPENEPWPPERPPWRMARSRLSRRMGCLAAFVFGLIFLLVLMVVGLALSGLALLRLPGPRDWQVPVAILLAVFGMGLIVLTGRGVRHLSIPLGDLLEAAGRIAEGDFSIRVAERGPAEVRSLARAFNAMASRLQADEAQRRDFLADITHELRTPLTVIRGNLEGMLDGVYAPDEARLKSVLEETQLLSRLVDDLRTLSLAESGALQLRKEPTDLTALIAQAVSAFRAQAQAGGIRLEAQIPADLPPLDLDPERIQEVLTNLIANALRFTSRGGSIEVKAAVESSDGRRRAAVTVTDDGAGIAPQDLPHVFDRFYKGRDSSGTGLGLPIAKHLVEAHGGTITAESQPGRGTAIRFTLPINQP